MSPNCTSKALDGTMSDRNELMADLLMGAAFADKRLDGREYEAVKRLLAQAMGVDTIPDEMESRLKEFDPKEFSVEDTVGELDITDEAEKRQVVELIAAVHEADEELDFDEDEYLREVAEALGLPPDAYSDLSFEILSVENVKAAGEAVLSPPPIPPPKD